MIFAGHRVSRIAALGGAAVLCALAPRAWADPVPPGGRADEAAPDLMKGVEIQEKLGARLPLDLTFADETGAPIRLGDLFDSPKEHRPAQSAGDVPVVLTFNYSNCPMLCSVQLGGLVDVLNRMKWSAGVEFRVITIVLNPMEGHQRAMATKLSYLERYKRSTGDEGWRFLTGTDAAIHALASAAGFGYRLNPATGDYLHPAALVIVTPKGVVSSYVYGVEYQPGPLTGVLEAARRGSLTEAARKFLLACFHYEPEKGAAGAAQLAMRVGGLLFVGGLLAAFGTRAARARARRARERTSEST